MFSTHWRLVLSLLTASSLCVTGMCVAQNKLRPEEDAKPAKKPKTTFVPKITIGKDTTWATEPVGPEGFVNYLEVVNRKYSQGVTPENNSVVLLYRAMGPAPEGGNGQPDEFFKLLGMEPPAAEGAYFEEFPKWWKRTGRKEPPGGVQALIDLESKSGTWPWTEKEYPEISEWLHDMEGPLALVTEASQRSEYYSPFVAANGGDGNMITVLLPGVQKSRNLCRALLYRSMMHLGNNDTSRAWADLITIHRLGRLVGRGPTLIESLVGIALESTAIDAELKLISHSRPPAKFVARYLKHIESLPPRSTMTEKLDFTERLSFLDFCHQFARGRMCLADAMGGNNEEWATKFIENIMVHSTDWDEVLKSGNHWYDGMVAISKIAKHKDREAAIEKLDQELKGLKAQTEGSNLLLLLTGKPQVTQFTSKILVALMLPATRQCLRAESRVQQRFQNLEVAFALSAWHGDHDAYPEKLDDLVPKYLAAPPRDLFSDQPLHYERTADGYRFYSVGDNGIDDKGLTFGDKPECDDLGVTMPVPPPAAAR